MHEPSDAPATTERPWGSELLWALTPSYAAKVLTIRAGHRTSLQHHERKEETLLVLDGPVLLTIEAPDGALHDRRLHTGERVHLPAGTRHRFAAPESTARLVEVSTPELADVVRHHDDYGRAPGISPTRG